MSYAEAGCTVEKINEGILLQGHTHTLLQFAIVKL